MGQLQNILSILSSFEKKKLTGHILLSTIISLLDIAFLGMALFLVSFYTKSNGPGATWAFPKPILEAYPLEILAGFLSVFALKNLLAFKLTSSQNRFAYQVAARISQQNLSNYFDTDYLDFVAVDSSVRIRKVSQQPIEFCHYVLNSLQDIITQAALITFTISAILIYNASLFVLLFLLLLPPVIFIGFVIKKKAKALRMNVKDAGEKSLQHLQESLSAYIESNLYHKKQFFTNRYNQYKQQLNCYLAKQQSLQDLPSRLIEIFALLGFFILIAISRYSQNGVNMVTIGIFMAAAYKIIPGIVRILNSLGQMKAYEFTVTDLLAEKKSPENLRDETMPPSIKSVLFNNVDFSFKGKNILRDFNLELSAGNFTAISGLSGKGKTTVINLLLGFLEPEKGSIDINYLPTTAELRKQYRKKIAYVKQQPFLIHDSIRKNISLSDEKCCPKKLAEALRISGLDRLIAQLPAGVDEVIRENGKNISGGQRQRIALARAVYKNADLIILDEAFSELDENSEKELLQHFSDMAENGKIIILISHNTDSLLFCNQSVSLDAAG